LEVYKESNTEQTPNSLLHAAMLLFMRFGVKSITMDDIAKDLGISKKTIYAQFSDKNTLVEEVVKHHIEETSNCCLKIFETFSNPIDQLFEIGKMFIQMTKQINPCLFLDLKKQHHQAWMCITDHKHKFIHQQIITNLKNGISNGYYHQDIHVDITAKLYVQLIDLVIDDELFPKDNYKYHELQFEIIKYHLRAITTEKGKNYLNQKLAENN
jgi:AcrR family transcriptional regulator